ncbi:MAG: hypothetical protein HYY57_05745 [Candidatus Omnitrophica bacterium]|nr:hypothetical protein [Candidatus Omnitrophota bacterium]
MTQEVCEKVLKVYGAVQDCGTTPSSGTCLGDVTQDKTRDLSDAIGCIRYLIGLDTLTGSALISADANQDGSVDLSDVIRLIRDLTGLEPLPACQ